MDIGIGQSVLGGGGGGDSEPVDVRQKGYTVLCTRHSLIMETFDPPKVGVQIRRYHNFSPILSANGANVFCFLSSLPLLPSATTEVCLGPTCLSSLYSLLTLYRKL
jgi:hypothetical protein